ncbi:L-serine ammonia-lyase, iron-sulfur-dependent subunit beta [Alicyclobacillus dauci]|uniref:L-serine deaminase n=1 Tax=Alicyclobacillus dauci TaxID=1475485 RepID=A0ABY6Z0A4_9BACL|nr:L-serine ammonia-lyase, iron-sulfur-dependent subunit beta [Alicyclobacillus dauci]WAH36304.1 L-serine ammonia-lyase, iron-sulfur-dependent subunit beta [Alicyclobacillus dauci]
MKYNSAFEIIGPIMVGPSSSHTAGAVRIGNLARKILGQTPRVAEFRLMGSFAETYQGHGTDLALLAGVLGFTTDHPSVSEADKKALELGLQYSFQKAHIGFFHPNTVAIRLHGENRSVKLIASSLGGGKVEVQELDELPIKFTGEKPTLILYHTDRQGFLANVSHTLDSEGYNIARLSLERWNRGGLAITVCEVDEILRPGLLERLKEEIPQLNDIRVVEPD